MLTTVAVVVGVSFVVGSFVLTDSLTSSINQLLSDATSHVDLVVSPASGGGRGARINLGTTGGGAGRRSLSLVPAELVSAVTAVPGVKAVSATVAGPAELLDKQGQSGRFDLTFLGNWPAHPEMSALKMISGHAPSSNRDVVVDTSTAEQRGLRLGSTVRIATTTGVVTATVSGLAERAGGNLGAAGAFLDFTLPRATQLVGTPGMIGGISVELDGQADHVAVTAAIRSVVGPERSVLSADTLLADARARIQERLANFNSLMLGFAAITLFVSGFLIWNTFSTVVAQRTRELALLRAVGASRAQVFRSVLGEGAVVGLTSSLIGLLAGVGVAIGLRSLLGTFGFDLPSTGIVMAPRSIAVGLGVGLGVTMVSVIGPARRSTSVPPIAAIAAAAMPDARQSRRPWLALAFAIVGLAFGARGVLMATLTLTQRMTWIGIGGALLFLGVSGLARHLTAPVIAVLGWPFRRLGSVAANLASRNAVRDPRRTASTALALMIGIALVAITLVLGESVKTAFGGALRASIVADVVVSADGISPIDDTTLASISKTAGVTSAVALPFARTSLKNSDRGRVGVTVGNVAAIAKVVNPGFLSGGYPTDDTRVAISKSYADENHLSLGSTMTLGEDNGAGNGGGSGGGNRARVAPVVDPAAPPTPEVTVTVSGIYQRDELLDDAVAQPATIAPLTTVLAVTKVVLVTTDQDPAVVAQRLARVAATIPNSAAQITDDYVSTQTQSFDVVLGIVDVLLLFAVLVAGLGIANTLALSIVERTRELGLLRAVGMDRRAMRRMVRVEGVLVALFGGVLGLALGISFGAAITSALPVDTATLTFPVGRLAALFAVAGLLGIISSAVPARRAARLDVLQAVSEV